VIAKTGLVLVALTFAVSTLERIAGTLGLLAGIIVSFGIIFAGSRQIWKFVRRLESVVENTSALPEFMREQRATNEQVQKRLTEENVRVHERLDQGAERMSRIEGSLNAWADAERAAITTAIEVVNTPRPPRSTDPSTE
jgi:biopolymer transport protein ExbB/TolQ